MGRCLTFRHWGRPQPRARSWDRYDVLVVGRRFLVFYLAVGVVNMIHLARCCAVNTHRQVTAESAFVRVMQYAASDIKIMVGSGVLTVKDARLPSVQPTLLRVGSHGDDHLWRALLQRLRASGLPLVRRPWPSQQRMVGCRSITSRSCG